MPAATLEGVLCGYKHVTGPLWESAAWLCSDLALSLENAWKII